MAYDSANLTRLAGGSGVSLWHYTTADAVAAVNTLDYFADSAEKFSVNDIILCVSSSGGTPVVTINYVNAVSATSVDVTDGLVVTATDTD